MRNKNTIAAADSYFASLQVAANRVASELDVPADVIAVNQDPSDAKWFVQIGAVEEDQLRRILEFGKEEGLL